VEPIQLAAVLAAVVLVAGIISVELGITVALSSFRSALSWATFSREG
jgi:hypothetical protein